jgi:hypothetical protein
MYFYSQCFEEGAALSPLLFTFASKYIFKGTFHVKSTNRCTFKPTPFHFMKFVEPWSYGPCKTAKLQLSLLHVVFCNKHSKLGKELSFLAWHSL